MNLWFYGIFMDYFILLEIVFICRFDINENIFCILELYSKKFFQCKGLMFNENIIRIEFQAKYSV